MKTRMQIEKDRLLIEELKAKIESLEADVKSITETCDNRTERLREAIEQMKAIDSAVQSDLDGIFKKVNEQYPKSESDFDVPMKSVTIMQRDAFIKGYYHAIRNIK